LARNFSFTSGHISQVVLCGAPGAAEPLRDFFTTTGKLQAELFNPQGVNPEWHLEGIEPHDSWLAPLLGTLVHADDTSEEEIAPDLMAPMRLLQREPLGPALVRYGWPLVAAAVVTLFVQGLAWWEQSRVDSLQADAEKARSASEQITVEQRELGLVEAKIRYWKVIDAARTHPRWHEFLASLGECLPEGMWLENIKVDREGKVLLTGPTYTEDAVYTLVEKLKQVPLLANVALEGTRSARLAGGPVTLFDVKASYAGGNDLQEGS
jgi:Tfp pilus assembly protein PilN